MPALSDLKIKENLRVSPGKITPEIREKMHWSARSHLVNLTLFQYHKCPYLSRRLFPHSSAGYHTSSSYCSPSRFTLSPFVPELVYSLCTLLSTASSVFSPGDYAPFAIRKLSTCEYCEIFTIFHPFTLSRNNLLSFEFQERDLPCTALLG